MHIGRFRHKVKVSVEYANMSKSDEAAAQALAQSGHYRQACYFLIQAIEKAIRSKIFTLVNPNLEYFREKNKSHSVESAVSFLIELIATDELVKTQVSKQIYEHVLGSTHYSRLHNNLRYPAYFQKYDSYSMLDLVERDYNFLKQKLSNMRLFLSDLDRVV